VTTFSRRAITPSKMSDNTASDSKIAAAPPAWGAISDTLTSAGAQSSRKMTRTQGRRFSI
jgi:hypothetical protein